MPILAAPVFVSQGAGATYALSFSASSSRVCFSNNPDPSVIFVPCLSTGWTVDGNGTIGRRATSVTGGAAVLNDTVSLASVSFVRCSELCTATDVGPLASHSFLESVNLTSRLVTFPKIRNPESFLGTMVPSYGSVLPVQGFDVSLVPLFFFHPVYTIWWVNLPLSLAVAVNVLTFSGMVNGTRMVDLESLGTRSAWTVSAGLGRFLPTVPCAVDMCTVNLSSFTSDAFFAYDQSSGMLLESNLDLQSFSGVQTYYYPAGATPYTVTTRNTFAFHASLKLISQDHGDSPFTGITSNLTNSPSTTTTGAGATGVPNHDVSPGSGLVATITEPRNLASISIAVALVGIIGLTVFRRFRPHT